ncbi:MAG: hypothetical protein IJN77_00425 [Oscillospiraceae bacterium]|nr:hypothetical protein [Oscillospiraceae bacterium]
MKSGLKVENMEREFKILERENNKLMAENTFLTEKTAKQEEKVLMLENMLSEYANLVAAKEKYAIELQMQLEQTNARLNRLESNIIIKVLRKVKRMLYSTYHLGYRILRKIYRTFIKIH